MRPFDASWLVEISERGARLGNAARALLLLEAQGLASDAARWLPLGARDRRLLQVRESMFGGEMVAHERCSVCGEDFEMTLCAEDVGLGPSAESDEQPAVCSLAADGGDYVVRALTAGDMAMAERMRGIEAARTLLLARVAPDAPEGEAPRIARALEQLDPLAHVSIAVPCPACAQENEFAFDAAAFIWREIEQRVPRLLEEVAELARVYHWSERDILEMPQSRRRFYLAAAGR